MNDDPHAAQVRPDYQGAGIANLIQSIAQACGANPVPDLPPLSTPQPALDQNDHLVLLVVDGLGDEHLKGTDRAPCLQKQYGGRLTSVFPSTTASAIPTFLTGVPPQQHGLTGWHMYFSEIDRVIATLPLYRRGRGPLGTAPAQLPAKLFIHAPVFDRIHRHAYVVSPRKIVESPFNQYHSGRAKRIGYEGVDELFAALETVIKQAKGQSYTYAYFSEIDALAHDHGIASEQVAQRLGELDQAFGEFLERIEGSNATVVVTADHGFIDSPPERHIDLADHPQLTDTLARPLCGERRVAYCYVKPHQRRSFKDYIADELQPYLTVHSSADLIDAGWYGTGTPHPRLRERVGDYCLIMKDNWIVHDHVPGERPHDQLGVHGGTSPAEMYVPLLIARA
ncbi:MAG: alkaline phosphatase family protein [Pseudomonadota bacterium]|nr:alkaline phosphatase family protein [Pseudomonadota bacterium]